MALQSTADVTVVGGGAMGAATAWWLARAGRNVTLIEQFEAGHTRGSSHGGVRIFRYAYPDPLYVALAVEAFDIWRLLEDETSTPLLDITGGLDHGHPPALDAIVAALVTQGIPCERLPPDAAARKRGYPDLPLLEGERVVLRKVTHEDQSQLTTWYTERAVKFIEEHKDRPFFVYVPHSMPHVPIFASYKFKGKSR